MEWLGAVGVLAAPLASIVDSVTGTGKAKADATTATANAQTAAAQAQTAAIQAAAEQTKNIAMYSVIGVAVIIAGVVAYKAVA